MFWENDVQNTIFNGKVHKILSAKYEWTKKDDNHSKYIQVKINIRPIENK